MKIRDCIISSVGLVSIFSSITISSTVSLGIATVPDPSGKPCDGCSCEGEVQDGSGGDGGKDNSDPINLATGDYQLAQTDLVIPGRGLDFKIRRFYRSYSGIQSADIEDYDINGQVAIGPNYFKSFDNLNGSSPLGHSWDFNYNMRLSQPPIEIDPGYSDPGPTGAPNARIYDPIGEEIYPEYFDVLSGNGRIDRFEAFDSEADPNASDVLIGHYRHDKGSIPKKLMYRGRQQIISILDSNMVEYRFHPVYENGTFHQYAGRLDSIVDRNGNTIQFHYQLTSTDGIARVDYAIDTLGNQIDFVYHDEVYNGASSPNANASELWAEHTIWIIRDLIDGINGQGSARREWRYDYTDGDLTSSELDPIIETVTLPKIEDEIDFPMNGDTQHARFDQTGDRSWKFEYTGYKQWRNRLITKVTNPNGDVILENEYYGGGQVPGDQFSHGRNAVRVKHQHYGNGTYSYIASHVNPSENIDPDDSINIQGDPELIYDYYVWVNDRRGAVTRFKYSGDEYPGNSSGPFHRALLEKVEFDGFVPAAQQGKVVWATVDSNENHTWYYLDSSNDPQPFTGPSGTDRFVKTWEWDSHWNPEQANHQWVYAPSTPVPPEQDSVTYSYDQSDEPLRWGAMLSRTQYDSDGAGGAAASISEDWLYDFEFGSGAGGSGCGCSSMEFVTAYRDGENNVTLKEYDSSVNAVTGRANGNLLKIYHDIPSSSVGSADSSLASAVEEFEYNAHGQVTKHIHSSKTTSTSTVPHHREDRFEYETDTASLSYGRMIRKIVDYGGLNLTTDFVYDSVGNRIATIDPGDDVTEYYYNQDSNLIKVEKFNSTETQLFSRVEYFYDANGNVVQEEVANLKPDSGSPGGALIDGTNPSFTTLYKYDDHDYLVQVASEHGVMSKAAADFTDLVNGKVNFNNLSTDDAHLAYEEWVFDEAKNLIKHVVGKAANGSDPTVVNYEYDARDLLIRQYFGVDELSILVDVEYERDHKGRIKEAHVNPNDSSNIQTYVAEYDGFDRIIEVLDPMGNTIGYEYDNNHNLTRTNLTGPYEVDTVASDTASSVILLDKIMEYDDRDRLKTKRSKVYDYSYGNSNTSIGSVTELVTEYLYNNDDSIKTVNLPTSTGSPHTIEYLYDTASRLVSIEDGDGNLQTYTYSADSEVLSQTQTDVASDGTGAEQRFTTEYLYDVLHRVTKITPDPQNLSLETLLAYDSRSNTIKLTDSRGNITEYEYDGMSRQTHIKTLMTSTGDGLGSELAGELKYIVRETQYDDSNRVIAEIDDDGNTTSYVFDGMNRLLTTTLPDSAVYTNVYDANNNLSKHTDARGVVIDQLFDKNNRLELRSITYPSGFGTPSVFDNATGLPTFEEFEYDGAGRVRVAENNFTQITREYDSLSNVVRELQNADAPAFLPGSDREVAYEFDAANNMHEVSSPSRSVYRSYDGLNRLDGIFNSYDPQTEVFSGPVIEFDYIGARVNKRSYGNGVVTDFLFTGYQDELNANAIAAPDNFGIGRVASITSANSSGIVDSHDFAWDKAQNRIRYERTDSTLDDRRERSFGYDSSNRLVDSIVVFPDLDADFANNTTSYTLDEVHNRVSVTELVTDQEDAGSGVGTYTLNASAPSSNNQYMSAPKIGSAYDWIMVYDENGNLILQIEDVPGNYNQDGNVDFFDVSAFMTDHANNIPEADLTGDGEWDHFDVSAFLLAYQEGATLDVERRDFRYDHRNQLVDHHVSQGANQLHTAHTYDPFARRLVESFDGESDDIVDSAVQFVYGCTSLWEILEQIDLGIGGGGESVLTTHVFGLGIDDEVAYRKENVGSPSDVYAHRDDLKSLLSTTDSNGDVLERFSYGDYGRVTVYDAAGAIQVAGSAEGAMHLYTGRVIFLGTDLGDFRFRVYSSKIGRFIQRDPLWYKSGSNLYSYVNSAPFVYTDPYGLEPDLGWDDLLDSLDDKTADWADGHPAYGAIVSFAKANKVPAPKVRIKNISGSTQGYAVGNKITLQSGKGAQSTFKIFIHELTHILQNFVLGNPTSCQERVEREIEAYHRGSPHLSSSKSLCEAACGSVVGDGSGCYPDDSETTIVKGGMYKSNGVDGTGSGYKRCLDNCMANNLGDSCRDLLGIDGVGGTPPNPLEYNR